jgi:hypothetical protein
MKTALTFLILFLASRGWAAEPIPPGIVVAHSPASSRAYLGSPSLAELPDGTLVASHDFFGPGTTFDVGRIYRSSDKGLSWKQSAEIKGMFWSSLFVHAKDLYLIGPNKQDGIIVVRRSKDGGFHWTEPKDSSSGFLFADAKYHCAPTPVIEHNGRLWRAFEDVMGPGKWASYFRSVMVSAPTNSDLLSAASWTMSSPIARNEAWLDGKFGGWLEGNAVVAPDHQIVNILRVDYRAHPEKAAMIQISTDGRKGSFDLTNGMIDFPGGCKKFVIRPDPKGGGYWALSNYVPEADRTNQVDRTRNTLALSFSPNLKNWEVRSILLHHRDMARHGFQYPDWLYDGEDIIALVRTAFDDEEGGAHNQHDANFITFHRWQNFRSRRIMP